MCSLSSIQKHTRVRCLQGLGHDGVSEGEVEDMHRMCNASDRIGNISHASGHLRMFFWGGEDETDDRASGKKSGEVVA